ncbi:hypothetical protein, partial [Paramesorhizobium deserti]|uniref:hypothetical protein n=1 Tax=Paramesorhizobium deserti TaxID=1494590 RepID=UPI001AECF49B
MIRSKTAHKLDGWLEAAKSSLAGSFASGVEKDIAAVRNAIADSDLKPSGIPINYRPPFRF